MNSKLEITTRKLSMLYVAKHADINNANRILCHRSCFIHYVLTSAGKIFRDFQIAASVEVVSAAHCMPF